MTTSLKILLPPMILAVSGVAAWQLVKAKPDAERRAAPVTAIRVDAVTLEPQNFPITLETRGTVQPRTESTLIPEVAGRVMEISPRFREGEFFEKGDVLLRIDQLDYETAETIARASLAQAQVVLNEEEARAEQAVENWKELGRQGTPNPLALRMPQLAQAEAQIASARAQLEKAMRDLDRTEIKAPYAGRVMEQNVDVGQYVSPGTILAQLFAVDYVEIRLPLTNNQLAHIELPERYRGEAPGDAPQAALPGVTFIGEIGGKRYQWKGQIVRVEGAIDERSRQLFVVAQVDDPYAPTEDGRPPLKIGLFVEAQIDANDLEDVFIIPRQAVRAGDEVILIDRATPENGKGPVYTLRRVALDKIWGNEDSVIARPNEDLKPGALLCTTPVAFAANGVKVLPTIDGVAPIEAEKSGPPGKGKKPG